MSFSNVLSAKLLDHLFDDVAYTPPASLFIALSDADPTDTGGGINEPITGGYARQLTDDTEWGAATVAAPSVKTNTTDITWDIATADYLSGADITHFAIFSLVTGGDFLAFGSLSVAKPVKDGDTAKFASGDLTLTLT